MALAEEIGFIKGDVSDANPGENRQVRWEKTFTSCFQKVDDEIGGKAGRSTDGSDVDASDAMFEPVAPETVGSTAVVALVCSSHIIVANCGDSRAVICRGKEPVPLSVDHKVTQFYSLPCLHLSEQNPPFEETNLSRFILLNFLSQTERMNMRGSRRLGVRSYSGTGTVFLEFLQCRDP